MRFPQVPPMAITAPRLLLPRLLHRQEAKKNLHVLERHRDAYHGTSLETAMNIQEVGFDVQRSGSNAGAALGGGLYVTPMLEKALNYAKHMQCQGAILHLCGTVLPRGCQRPLQRQLGKLAADGI
jgi:hypothetical protein